MAQPDGKARAQAKTAEVTELIELGDLEQASASYESAIKTYRRALDAGASGRDKARALREVGSCLERIGRLQEAHSVLMDARKAAESAADAGELGRTEIKLGKIHFGRGQIDAAVQSGRRALDLLDSDRDSSARGFALNLLGSAYSEQGDLDTSAQCFEEALSAFKHAGDIRSLALAYNNLGLVYKERCDWSRSLEYLQVASNLQAVEGDYPKRRSGRHNLGLVHFRMGQLDRAESCFAEAEEIARGVQDIVGVIRALLGRAGVSLVRRQHDVALESLEQVLELCSDESYPRETALTYRSLGQLHQARGNLSRAQRCFEVAWRTAIEISPEGDLARELLRLRADLALAQDRCEDAENLARRAVALSESQGDRIDTALSRATLGRILVSQGNAQGYGDLAEGESMLRKLATPLPLVHTLMAEAALRLERGEDLVQAEEILREARALLQNLGLDELGFEAAVLLAQVAAGNLDLDRATDYLDQARALSSRASDPALLSRLEDVQSDLERRLVESSVTHMGTFKTAGRLEEIVESQRPNRTKIADVLELLSAALEADGAALVSGDAKLGVFTHRIGSATAGNLERAITRAGIERPELILDVATSRRQPWVDVAQLRQASSLMILPIHSYGPTSYLYLDRLAEGHRSAFGPSHLSLALALVTQISALLDRIALDQEEQIESQGLERRIFLADVVTQNPEMVQILKLVEKVSSTELTVLLQGETGTGKTLIARAIHLTSERKDGPFVTVDCAALPENLLESELFGFVKGAFTGAATDKKGLFEEADGGTIFLDEIGKSGLGVQRRLLHLLDQGEVRPVGSTSYRKLNVRVICATSKDNLLAEDADTPFIKDLFYRLNDIIIKVPSLSDRPEDIPLLSEYFLETFNQQTGTSVAGFSRAAMQRMIRYSWPGNVRELEKVVRRAAILADLEETVGVDLLPPEVVSATDTPKMPAPGTDAGLRGTVEDMERRMVLEALEQNRWNKTRAAQALGLSRKGLKNKIARYGLAPRGA